jgi:hypothetical protein
MRCSAVNAYIVQLYCHVEYTTMYAYARIQLIAVGNESSYVRSYVEFMRTSTCVQCVHAVYARVVQLCCHVVHVQVYTYIYGREQLISASQDSLNVRSCVQARVCSVCMQCMRASCSYIATSIYTQVYSSMHVYTYACKRTYTACRCR